MLRFLLVAIIITQTMAYYPYQSPEEKMPEEMPMPQPMKRGKNGGGNGGSNGKGKNMGGGAADDDSGEQQMMQAPPIRILSMKKQMEKDGTYSYMYETENGISMQEMGYVKQGPPSGKNAGGDKHEEYDGKPEYITVAQGSYSYTSPEGVQVSVNYIADENGFQTFEDEEEQNGDGAGGMQMPMPMPMKPQMKGGNGKGSNGDNGGGKRGQMPPQKMNGGKTPMKPMKMPSKPQMMMMEQEKPEWNQETAYSSPAQQYQYSLEGTDSNEEENEGEVETPEQMFGHFFRH